LAGEYGDGDGIAVDAVGNRLEVYKTYDGGYNNGEYAQVQDDFSNPAGYSGYQQDYSETPPFN